MAEVQQTAAKITEQTYRNQRFENGEKWYLNEVHADVHFTFGAIEKASERVPANKMLLATDSRVFEAMFYGDLKEPGDVHVPDSTEVAFKEFLQYFYLTEVKMTAENVAGVLHLGEKYDVKKCVTDCVRFLVRTLDNENVCAYLHLAILYDKKQLIELCEKRIMLNTEVVFGTVNFLECTKKALGHILKMGVLSCAEDEVFKACMSWVKAKSDGADLSIELVEQHLGDLYYDIRLASLTLEQLCLLQKQYESVLTRDFIHLINIITLPESPEPKFKVEPRHGTWNAMAIIKCERVIDKDEEHDEHREYHNEHAGYDSDDSLDSDCSCGFHNQYVDYGNYDRRLGATDETTFSVNKPLLLGSLMCFVLDDCYLQSKMEIIEMRDLNGTSRNTLLKMKIELKSSDARDIPLPHPVLVRPGFIYTIRLGPFPKNLQYYCKDRKENVELVSRINIKFHKNYTHSLIKVLKFNRI